MITNQPRLSGVVLPSLLDKIHDVYMAIIAFEQANAIQLDESDMRPILCDEHPLYAVRFMTGSTDTVEIISK